MMTPDTTNFAATPWQASTLVDLLGWRAQHQPDQRAYTFLVDGDTTALSLTYAELDRQARAIGVCLQDWGMAGERALLLYPPGLEYIAAFFGCLYAGVVAVPVYPPRQRTLDRLLAILTDAQARIALTTAAIRSTLDLDQAPALQQLCWLVTGRPADSKADSWHRPDLTGDTLAFLQYTSGSTGTPKGVMLSHGHLLHNQRLIQQAMEHTEHAVILGWLPLYHDMGLIGTVFQPLFVGCPCILMSPFHFLQQPWRWLRAIAHYGATTSGGPNFAYDLCARRITPEQRATLDLSSWQVAFNGAEPIHAATLERFATVFEPCGFRREAFYPCYGLAEATLMVSGGARASQPVVKTFASAALAHHRVVSVSQSAPGARTLVSCGHALSTQRIVIVDPESLRPCRANQVGEIWLQGASVARGYWRRPADTAATFQAQLVDSGDGPFLRTGDLGFVFQDELFVTGRRKELLIIRGRNHYPQDIELTVQQSHPFLRPGCGAAFAVEGDADERLVVVQEVEARQEADLAAVTLAIRQAIAQAHEVQVSAIILIRPGSVPKTSSGKIQRYACRARFLAGNLEVVGAWRPEDVVETGRYVAPRTPLEETVAAIWGQVFGMPRVSMDANFFALGGDSLLGSQIMARVRDALQLQVPLESLFEAPTVVTFCKRLAHTRLTTPTVPVPPLRPGLRTGDLPLSFAQQRQWFLEQLALGLPVFTIPLAFRLRGRLQAATLRHSIQAIVQRHESLRTTFPAVHGQPVQRVLSTLPIDMPIIDLRALSSSERLPQALRLVTATARQPFDLSRGPLLRTVLVRLDSDDYICLLTMHHIVSDFWSMRVFVRELTAFYDAFAGGRPAPLPELRVQYADFAQWQRQWLQGEVLATSLAYWRQRLAGAPAVLALPTDRPRPAMPTFRGAMQPFVLPPPLAAALVAWSRQEGVTLFVTLLTAFKTLLYHYAGAATDVVVGVPIAGRTRVEVEGLIGYFLNALALRTDLAGDPSWREILQRVHQVALEAYTHQELPFEKLVEVLRPERSLHHTPVFQVVFNFQNVSLPPLQLAGMTPYPLELDTATVKHDLTLYMRPQADGLEGVWAYNTDLFEPETIASMREDFLTLLYDMVADPNSRLQTVSNRLTQVKRQAQMQQQQATNAANLSKLGRAKRQALPVSPAHLVSSGPLQPGESLPLLVQPAQAEVDLSGWARDHLSVIETALLQYGAILFRGFKISSVPAFTHFAGTVVSHLLDYIEGASPRLAVGDNVYTSTEYPAAYAIAMHNELSYSHAWPGKLFFCCLAAAPQGGETPLADSRKVFNLLAPDIKQRFRDKGVRYVRNFHAGQGSGPSWQTVFATTDKARVEAYCRESGIAWRWKADGGLWISQVRPACLRHPRTDEPVWFNQAHQWHISNLAPEVARALAATLSEDEFPMHAAYGDGTPLEPAGLEAIRAAYRQVTVTFAWQAGDILLLDNMLTAHGRRPFTGSRTVLVAMGDPVHSHEVREVL